MSFELEIKKIETMTAVDIFEGGKLPEVLNFVKETVSKYPQRLETKQGRDEIKSIAHKISRCKTFIDDMGKSFTEDLKKKTKEVDSIRKEARDFLDNLKEEYRKPLTDLEEKEEARIDGHKKRIAIIENLKSIPFDADSVKIQAIIDEVSSFDIGSGWDEFEGLAKEKLSESIELLTIALKKRKDHEKQQEELEQLRKEKAEKERIEREEKIAKDAAENERLKIEAENNKIEEEKKKREADIEHRRLINNEILQSMISYGLDESSARVLISHIAQGNIKHVKINY